MGVKGDLPGNWDFFEQQWSDYEIATKLVAESAEIRMATLRSVMGKECLHIFKSLSIPDADKKDPEKSLKALQAYFKPKRNVVYERYIFWSAHQGQNEQIDTYVTRLRHLAQSCEFGNMTDQFIRDRIVLGTNDSAARARMFREQDLNLDSAMQICRVSEITQQQLKSITKSDDVQYAKASKFANKSQKSKTSQQTQLVRPKVQSKLPVLKHCKYCGQSHARSKDECPAYGKKCVSVTN